MTPLTKLPNGRDLGFPKFLPSILFVAPLLIATSAYASSDCMWLSGIGAGVERHVIAGRSECCLRMKASDTLTLHGHSQHAERFVECIVGHWPNVDSVFRQMNRR